MGQEAFGTPRSWQRRLASMQSGRAGGSGARPACTQVFEMKIVISCIKRCQRKIQISYLKKKKIGRVSLDLGSTWPQAGALAGALAGACAIGPATVWACLLQVLQSCLAPSGHFVTLALRNMKTPASCWLRACTQESCGLGFTPWFCLQLAG